MSILNRLKLLTLSNVACAATSETDNRDSATLRVQLKPTGDNWITWEQQIIPILWAKECLDENKLPMQTLWRSWPLLGQVVKLRNA
jgi:hypothetical protein